MAGDSNIEWTDATWNPIVGCSIVSPGCTNCYAMKMAALVSQNYLCGGARQYIGTTKKVNGNAVWTGKVALAPDDTLTQPLRWKKPRRIFVNPMGDLFHESIPDEWIDKVFAVMALSPQHTFHVLTKRAERMRLYCSQPTARNSVELEAERIKPSHGLSVSPKWCFQWPLPNVWLGISAERQQEADERIPHLLNTPAAIRFVSAEPLLGAINFTEPLRDGHPTQEQVDGPLGMHYLRHGSPRLDWIIVGGESGPRARPMHPQWARDIRDQCDAAGVPFFFKQWGEWAPSVTVDDAMTYARVGKKSAGRLLDGKEHNAFPNPRPSSPEATIQGSSEGERVVAGADGGST